MNKRITLTSRIIPPLLLSSSAYIVLSSYRLAPIPLYFVAVLVLSFTLIALSIRIVLREKTGLVDPAIIALVIVMLGVIGLLDWYITFTLLLALILSLVDLSYIYVDGLAKSIKSNMHLIVLTILYASITVVVLRLDFIVFLAELTGINPLRMFTSLIVMPKLMYLAVSLVLGLAVIVVLNSVLGLIEKPYNMLSGLQSSLVDELKGMGLQSVCIEILVFTESLVVYPVIVYLLVELKIPLEITYIAGIVVSFIVWFFSRKLLYILLDPLRLVELRSLIWLWFMVLLLVLVYYSFTVTGVWEAMLFNKVYREVLDLEINSLRTIVELLWG